MFKESCFSQETIVFKCVVITKIALAPFPKGRELHGETLWSNLPPFPLKDYFKIGAKRRETLES